MSPITLYELISHLQDPDPAGGDNNNEFRRVRGHLLICRDLELLDDPYADMARRIGIPELAHPSRFEEADVLRQVLDAIDASDSLEELQEQRIQLADDLTATCLDLGKTMKQWRDANHRKYEQYVRFQYKLLLEEFGDQMDRISGDRFATVVEAGSSIMVENFNKTVSVDPDEEVKVKSAMYLHLGYVVARTIFYASKAKCGQDIKIDVNDAEDGAICQHLDLSEERKLVTEDKGTYEALKMSLAALEHGAREANIEIAMASYVIDLAGLRCDVPGTDG